MERWRERACWGCSRAVRCGDGRARYVRRRVRGRGDNGMTILGDIQFGAIVALFVATFVAIVYVQREKLVGNVKIAATLLLSVMAVLLAVSAYLMVMLVF